MKNLAFILTLLLITQSGILQAQVISHAEICIPCEKLL